MHRNLGIGSWIARRARMTPHRIALIAGERRWTYAELDERITCLAHGLLALGIEPGDRVAFLGGNQPAALESLFACGLIGAIALPLHPGFDDLALTRALADARPRALIVVPEHVARVERMGQAIELEHVIATGPVAGVTRYEDLIADASAEPLDRPVALDDTCLLAFSSGTTGRSKGVMLSHGNVFFNVVNVLSCIDFIRDDVLLASAPLYRMGGLGFTLPTLFKGGTCVLQDRSDPGRSLELIERHRVSVVFDAPSVLEAIAGHADFARADLSTLRVIATGGTQVSPALISAYLRRGLRVRQGYGLTEAAPLALMLDDDEVATAIGTAGRQPLYGEARVVADDGEDAAPGTLGELVYSGPNVMQGYWEQPEATARVLSADGWLRTGDAACVDSAGLVSIAGRVEDLLWCAGRRVDPGPIEHAVRLQAGVDCAIVQASADAAPVAFVVAAPERTIDERRIDEITRAFVTRGCAVHVRSIAALPRNANGKLLRGELRSQLADVAPTSSQRAPLRARSQL